MVFFHNLRRLPKYTQATTMMAIEWLLLLLLLSGLFCHSSWAFSPMHGSISSTTLPQLIHTQHHRICHHHSPRTTTTTTTTTTRLWRQPSKWDLILDELEDDDDDENENETDSSVNNDTGPRQYTPCPPDMMYEPRIVQRAHQTFLAIRQAGGNEMTNDVYVRDPVDKEVLWYTGKVARVSDVSLEDCIHRLYPMIERHACHLRPLELYPHRGGGGTLEVWTAPGDSETEVAYNRPTLKMQRFVHSPEWQYNPNPNRKTNNNNNNNKYPSHIKAAMVGFQGEVYQDGEDGFRTWRHDDGLPARPEINPGRESRPPMPKELEPLQTELWTQSPTKPPDSGSSSSSSVIDAVVSSKTEDTSSGKGSSSDAATP